MLFKTRLSCYSGNSFALPKDAELDNARQCLENVGHALDAALTKAQGSIASWRRVGSDLQDFSDCLDALYPEQNDVHRKVFHESAQHMSNLNRALESEKLDFGNEARLMERTVRGFIGEIDTLKREYHKVMTKHTEHAVLAKKLSKMEKKSDSDIHKIKAVNDEANAKHGYRTLLRDTIERMESSYNKSPAMFKIVYDLYVAYNMKILQITGSSLQGLHSVIDENRYSLYMPRVTAEPTESVPGTENECKTSNSRNSVDTFD